MPKMLVLNVWLFVLSSVVLADTDKLSATSNTLDVKELEVKHSDCQIFPNSILADSKSSRFTIIDLKTQHLACYEKGVLVRICDISTAKKGYPDLIGHWKVVKKSKDAISSIWKDDMGNPFAMPWAVAIGGGYWIHQGVLPGYPASHGCVRVRRANARWYFHWSKSGDLGCSYLDFEASLKNLASK
jgi:hypothetical protein